MKLSLKSAARALGVELDDSQCEQLVVYGDLIRKWNKSVNLISRRDIVRLEERHVLDSLAAVPFVSGDRLLDIGSGAGLPGLVLAIALPQAHVTLCDRMTRRCRFLNQAKSALQLQNVDVLEGDADRLSDVRYTTITARAVAQASVVWSWVEHNLSPTGCVLVFSSTRVAEADDPDDEAEKSYDIPHRVTYHRYQLPGIAQPHILMQMEPDQ